jgi:hypothetical protein
MNGIGKKETAFAAKLRLLIGAIAIGAVMFAYACGGDTTSTNAARQYPTGISDDIHKQLKYDSRVQDYTEDGSTLYVNVNDSWMQSPPGMRERALGQWYSLWQNAQGKQDNLKVVVQYEGNALDSWSDEKGFQPAEGKKKSSEAEEES